MKKRFGLLLLALVFLFAFEVVNAEEYLTVDRDEQSVGVETTQLTEEGSWELFYDADSKRFNVVYNINTDAPDEITLDLTQALNVLTKYVDGTLENNERVQAALEAGNEAVGITVDGVYFKIDLKAMKSTIYTMPGDRIAFNVVIKNNSGKKYFYKKDSLVIATPKQKETESEIVGFDGQNLDPELTSAVLSYGYNGNLEDHNIINTMVDRALEAYPIYGSQMYVNASGALVGTNPRITIAKGSQVVKIKNNYFYKIGEYYTLISSSDVDTETMTTKRALTSYKSLAYDSNGEKVIKVYTRKNASRSEVFSSLGKYLDEYYGGDDEKFIREEFNARHNKSYNSFEEFTKEDFQALLNELNTTYMYQTGGIKYNSSVKYDNFYKGLFSLIITSAEDYDANYKKDDSWATNGETATTIGTYMDEKVNGIETGKYKEVDSFLKETLGTINKDEEKEFVYGVNIDGYGTNNNYMGYTFGYYASFKLYAIPYNVYVEYIDVDGKVVADPETYIGLYTDEEYKTIEKVIDGYELVRVDGEREGVIQDKDVYVTYVYEYVMGEGGEEFDVVQTGSEVDYSVMSSALITLSLIGIAIYSKKRNNN